MRTYTRMIAIALMSATTLIAVHTYANAGRTGGPMNMVGSVAPYDSAFYDIPFNAGQTAVVSIQGNGNTNLQLFLHDDDGHTANGLGYWDQRTVSMDVYRAGFFRVEVRNLGARPNTFVISTN